MRVTIRDVAKAANCSISAVSSVLNGKVNNVSAETREIILRAVENLNYVPNKLAASLVSGKTRTIGLIVPDNRNPFFASILNSVQSEADQNGFRVISGNSNNEISRDLSFIETFVSYCVDGILIVRNNKSSFEDDDNLQKIISKLKIPVVAIDRIIEGACVPTFVLNNIRGGFLATEHLIKMGHTRIGCFAGPLSISSAQSRLEGYKTALSTYGIPFNPGLVVEGNYQMDGGPEAFLRFNEEKVTAIFSHNDMQAYNLYRQIKLSGKSIPEDFSLVGFDDLDFSSVITPSLTTIHYPIPELTKDAFKCLLSLIDNRNDVTREQEVVIEYEPELVCRDSVQNLN